MNILSSMNFLVQLIKLLCRRRKILLSHTVNESGACEECQQDQYGPHGQRHNHNILLGIALTIDICKIWDCVSIKEKLDLYEISNCDDTITVGFIDNAEGRRLRKRQNPSKAKDFCLFKNRFCPLSDFRLYVKVQPNISGAIPQFDVVTSISKLACIYIFTNFRVKVVFNKLIKLNKNWQNFKRIGFLIFPGIWASEDWGTIECLKKEGSNSPRLTHSLAGMQKSQRLIPLLLLLPPASSFHFSLVTSLAPSFLVTSAFLLSHSGKASPGHFSPSKHSVIIPSSNFFEEIFWTSPG